MTSKKLQDAFELAKQRAKDLMAERNRAKVIASEMEPVGPTPFADEVTAWLYVERFFEKP